MGLSYGEQLDYKSGRVRRAVEHYASLERLPADPVAAAASLVGYRTRAKLMAGPEGKLGLFAKAGGHEVVDIPGCRVLTPALERVAAYLRTRLSTAQTAGGTLEPFAAGGHGCLRAVDLREVRSDDHGPEQVSGVLVTFVVERARAPEVPQLKAEAAALMLAHPEVLGVAANFHVGDNPQVLGGETLVLAGASAAPDRIGTSLHFATFGSFVQAHREQAARVHSLLIRALGLPRPSAAAPRVLDLYGGSGAIGLAMAAAGARVLLVESFAPAAAQAGAAAKAQGLDLTAQRADAAMALRTLWSQHERFDAVIVNPPRRGIRPDVREGIARLEPEKVAYVSCDPETLARDIDHLGRLGYAAVSLHPIDMIPLTEEVEAVAILRRGAVPAPRVLYETTELLIVEKGPHEPTTPQGEYASSLLARARRLPAAESCVAVHRLDVGTSGVLMLARRPEFVEKWAGVLSAPTTRKFYVAVVRGVTEAKGIISRDLRDGGKDYRARTRYRRLAVVSGQSVLRVAPEQGRTHQIRRHLACVGHPVLGDDRYGSAPTNRHFEEKNALDRPFLHCSRLEFDHPDTGVRQVVEAPLPGDLRAVLGRISGPGTLTFLDQKNALGPSGRSMAQGSR
jgi:23S rRNA (uracil1939-C5)-methyltransferase